MKLRLLIWPLLTIPIAGFITAHSGTPVREVLTSQQLFVTRLTPLKKTGKKQKVKMEVSLRDAFKVIRYQGDSSYIELDWTQCPNGQCPAMGQFEGATAEYLHLDSLITSAHR
jgi:hypothetical protein